MEALNIAVLVAACVVAAVLDVAHRRVPNWLTYGAFAIAMAIATATGGAALAILGAISGGLLVIPGYWTGSVGAGDVKLIVAVGAFLGPGLVLDVASWSVVLGAAFAAAVCIRHGLVRIMFEQLRLTTWSVLTPGVRLHRPVEGVRFAFAPSIATAVILVLAMPHWRPFSNLAREWM